MKIICDECKHEFSMNSVKIQEAPIILDKQEMTLVYFTCPKCNKIYRISIEDKRYYELKKDIEKTKKRIRKYNGSGDSEMARVLNSMVNKKHQRLKNHVEYLKQRYPGTFTFVASENNHEDKTIKYLP